MDEDGSVVSNVEKNSNISSIKNRERRTVTVVERIMTKILNRESS